MLGGVLLALAVLLAAAGWLDAGSAGPLAWLAQVPAALGVAHVRGTREGRPQLRDAWGLLLLWGGAFLLAAALAALPLSRLLAAPSLGATLALSAAAGIVLVVVWRHWPAWHALERDGVGLRAGLAAATDVAERHAWRGLQVALPVAVLLALGVALAWPGLLADSARVLAAAALALMVPLAHLLLQATPRRAPVRGLPIIEMAGGAAEQADAHAAVAAPSHEADAALAVPAEVDIEALNRDLYAAARNGRVDRAIALLDAGAQPNALPEAGARDRRSLVVLAALLPDLRLLRALIQHGADVNLDHAGMRPLLAATRDSWHGRPEAVMTLLTNGADPLAVDADGNTPLHHAARSSDAGVAALLHDAGAPLDALNSDGVSPLGVACSAGNWRLARFLLERGASTDPAGGQPVLLAAAATEDDDAAGVQLLLRHKARIDARDGSGRSALHGAALAGHAGICETLLDAGAVVDAIDADGRTPLHDAIRATRPEALDVLLAARANPRACDASGANALHLACAAEAPSSALVRRLLELGVDPAAHDHAGRSALDVATAAGRWTLVAAMDPERALPASLRGDEVAPPDRPPLLLLREGLMAGAPAADLARLRPLLGSGEMDALLCDPEVAADASRVHWLLRHGADPEACVGGARAPMQVALGRGADGCDVLQLLFAHGGSPAGRGGLARFLAACGSADAAAERVAIELLERGADPFGASPAGDPPLALALRLQWSELLRRLVAIGVDLDARDAHGLTPLHLAASLRREDALKLLVAAGANPGRRAADGQTPLGLALAAGRRDLAAWLDWRGWKLPGRPLRGADLPAAAMAGDLEAVRRLLELGLPLEATDRQGCSALLRAAGGGHREVVELLLARGADPNRAAHTGATPLSVAVSTRQADIVQRLLAAGADLEQRLPGEVTVLMLAAALGLPDLASRLLQAGADLHARDAQGLTPLHCAMLHGFGARDSTRLIALLDTLLLAGADAQLADGNGVTPLLLLLGARAEPGSVGSEDVLLAAVERLLDEDVRLDDRDARGFGPLHLCGLHGLQRLAQLLLQQGADPNQRDALNRSPREIAQLRGFVDVAAALEPSGPTSQGISMARFLRDSQRSS